MNTKRMIIPLSEIQPDPKNPRQDFDPKKLAELEESIRNNGILSPLVVEEVEKGEYLLIDGERRYRASKKIGLKEVPVTIMPNMTDTERLIKRFHLQEQHSNWNHYEKSVAISELQRGSDITISELARILGISVTFASKYILVSSLSKRTANEVVKRKLPFHWIVEIAYTLRSVEDAELRFDLEEALFSKVDNKMILSAREIQKYRVAIKEKGTPIVKKIISDPKYSPTKAGLDSGTENVINISQLGVAISQLISVGKKIIDSNPKSLPESIHNRIVKTKKIIDELNDIDYEEEKEK